MPGPAETVAIPGDADGDADAAISGHALEDDVEDGEVDGVALELGGFDDGYEEDGERNPPQVVGELTAELLAEEVGAGPGGSIGRWLRRGFAGEMAFQGANKVCGYGISSME